jgi:urease gamma subunit
MVNHMKTTLNISDVIMGQLRREAARQGRTMSELVEAALRTLLQKPQVPESLPPLPEFSSGGARVNVANRDALYDVMDR